MITAGILAEIVEIARFPADKLRMFNLEYKAYYWRKYHEVSKYQHKRALAA